MKRLSYIEDARCLKVKRDLKEIIWKGVAWIDLAQERDSWLALVNAVTNLRVP